jgi:hypothetical protein
VTKVEAGSKVTVPSALAVYVPSTVVTEVKVQFGATVDSAGSHNFTVAGANGALVDEDLVSLVRTAMSWLMFHAAGSGVSFTANGGV